jgi:NAD+ kinase
MAGPVLISAASPQSLPPPPPPFKMAAALSPAPEHEVFSTPPSTPREFPAASDRTPLQPSLTRKSSRPSSLHIQHFAPDDVVVDDHVSPNPPLSSRPVQMPIQLPPIDTPDNSSPSSVDSSSIDLPPRYTNSSINSPCFLHSNLDKGADLTDWLRNRQGNAFAELGVSKSLQSPLIDQAALRRPHKLEGSDPRYFDDCDDDDESSASLTKQLAETAVGVREMSKQLGTYDPVDPLVTARQIFLTHHPPPGRARIRSSIQNVLIVTKARDNRLIKLTRELALYLMLRKGNGGRGLVVYVHTHLHLALQSAKLNASYLDMLIISFVHRVVSMLPASNVIIPNSSSRFPGAERRVATRSPPFLSCQV